jgi:hypothetical protein
VVAGITLVRLLVDNSPADLDPITMFGQPSEASGGSVVMPNVRLWTEANGSGLDPKVNPMRRCIHNQPY